MSNQLRMFPERRVLGDSKAIRIFVRVCIDNYRDAVARYLPPHEVDKRKRLLQKIWSVLDDARVRHAR